MKFHDIHYNCRICGRAGVAKASLDCSPEWIDKLAPGICCNICADAREHREKAEEQIFRACHLLKTIDDVKDVEKAAKIRTGARKALEVSVPNFARSVCDGYRLQLMFERAFIDDFYANPEKAGHLIGQYRHRVREISEQQPTRVFDI